MADGKDVFELAAERIFQRSKKASPTGGWSGDVGKGDPNNPKQTWANADPDWPMHRAASAWEARARIWHDARPGGRDFQRWLDGEPAPSPTTANKGSPKYRGNLYQGKRK